MTFSPQRTGLHRRTWMAGFTIISFALIALGYGYYRHEAESIHNQKYEAIAAIAEMKAGQIVQWKKERLSDARRVANGPVLKREVLEILHQSATPEVRQELEKILDIAQESGFYSDVLLVAPDGTRLLSSNTEAPTALLPATQRAVEAALASPDPVLSDFFRESTGHVHLDTVAAVRDAGGKAVALVILRCNAEDYLYPLINSWPTPNRTAETLLVKRVGEELVFLNELRHRSKTALILREPLTQVTLPAVQAVLGRRGMFEGKDYRNEEVLADLRPVPGTPWLLVAKVDKSEILTEARYRAGATASVVGALILLAAAATAAGYKQRQAGLYRNLISAERAQREAFEQFRTTLYSIGDAVITADIAGRVREMNPVAELLTGWPEAQAQGKLLEEIFRIINQETRATVDNPVTTVLREGVVVGLANHTVLIARDGTERAIADSAAPIRDENGAVTGVVLVFSDVSEQYRVQEALRKSERDYRTLFEGMLDGFAVHELICDAAGKPVDYRFLSVNPAFERLTGLLARDVVGRTVREVMPEIEPQWIERYGRVVLTGEPVFFEEHSTVLDLHFEIAAFRPQPGQFATVFNDVTQRKAAEAKVQRISRFYAALSQCNQAIVRSVSVAELYPQICRDAVEFGGMKMAWIGLIDETTRDVSPVAAYGEGADYLNGIQISTSTDDPYGRGPTGTAIRENRPCWCQDFLNDPATSPWQERGAKVGWASAAALPLLQNGKPIGALTLYSDKVDAFDTELRKLMVEMADDISFALDNFEREAARRQAEDALQRSRNMLAHILNSVTQSVFWKDHNSVYLGCNAAFLRTAGLTSQEEILGKTDLDLPWPRQDAEGYIADDREVMENNRPKYHIIEQEQRVDGTRLWVDTTKVPLADISGHVYGVLGVYEDITERKEAEEALQETKAILQAAMDNSQAGIAIADAPDGKLRYVNKAGLLIRGTGEEEAVKGVDINKYVSSWQLLDLDETPLPPDQVPLARAILYGETCSREFMIRRPDNEDRVVWANAAPILDGEGSVKAGIVVFIDITERKEAEESLRVSLREKESLLKEVHHRVKNNLQVITSLLRLEEGRIDHPSTRDVLQGMQSRIRSMSLLHEMLYRAENLAQVDLGDYLKQITSQLMRSLSTRPSAVQIQLDAGSVCIDIDQAIPCGLIVNELVSNGLKHGFPGGRTGEVRIALCPVEGGPQLCLRVSDTGVGLPADFDQRRAQSLGLQLVEDLTRQLQGKLEIGPGPGAVFEVTFTPTTHSSP